MDGEIFLRFQFQPRTLKHRVPRQPATISESQQFKIVQKSGKSIAVGAAMYDNNNRKVSYVLSQMRMPIFEAMHT